MAAVSASRRTGSRAEGRSALLDRAIDYQQNDGADHRADKTGGLPGLVDTQCLATIGGGDGAADAEQEGHDPAHAVVARFEQACEQPDDQADEKGADDAHEIVPRK